MRIDDAEEDSADLDSENVGRPLSPEAEYTEELPPVDALKWARDIFDGLGDQKREVYLARCSNKTLLVLNIVTEAVKMKENILVFVHSIPILEYLAEALKRKKESNVYVLTGGTPMKERQAMIDKFNRDHSAIYLISSKVSPIFASLIIGRQFGVEHHLRKSCDPLRFDLESCL
jgi:SNF2 family DNA or RNA helicase